MGEQAVSKKRPTYRQTDMRQLVRQADGKPSFYPTYEFTGRTFVKRDVPGKKPTK